MDPAQVPVPSVPAANMGSVVRAFPVYYKSRNISLMISKLRKTLFCCSPSALLTEEDYCGAEVSVAGRRCVLSSNQMISHETGAF